MSKNKNNLYVSKGKNGDSMRIPGVLDFTGAKYPFKKRLVKKHSSGAEISGYNPYVHSYYDPNTYSINWYSTEDPVYVGEDGEGIPLTFKDVKHKTILGRRKRVGVDEETGEIYVSSPRVNKGLMEEALPLESDRAMLYDILDPRFPAYTNLTDSELTQNKSRIDENDNLNNRIKKLSIIYDISGRPKIDLDDKSPGFGGFIPGDRQYNARENGKTVLKLRGHDYGTINTFITEMAHAFQLDSSIAKMLGYDKKYYQLAGGDIKDRYGLNGYARYGHSENDAHEILENAFTEFVFNKKYKSGKDLINLINHYNKLAKKQYKNKVLQVEEQRRNNPSYSSSYWSGMPMNKSGGLLFSKSGIKIKKQNRGKFTDYCGGNVTQNCINRAKKSGNKTLVKRAVFAENARHFKHRSGGQII